MRKERGIEIVATVAVAGWLLMLFGCAPKEQRLEPDAGMDCCVLYPDDDAIRGCVLAQIGPTEERQCGVAVCRPDGGYHRVNFCTEGM